MDFRWIAGIALWTFLSGPAIGPPAGAGTTRRPHATVPARRATNAPVKRTVNQKTTTTRDYTRSRN